MLVIRLTRVGKRKQPTYRLVVQEKHQDPWGKAQDIVGHYNPRSNPKALVLKEDRIKDWISKGAQPSPAVHNLLVNAKVIAGEKIPTTRVGKSGSKAAEAKEAAEKPKAA